MEIGDLIRQNMTLEIGDWRLEDVEITEAAVMIFLFF